MIMDLKMILLDGPWIEDMKIVNFLQIWTTFTFFAALDIVSNLTYFKAAILKDFRDALMIENFSSDS